MATPLRCPASRRQVSGQGNRAFIVGLVVFLGAIIAAQIFGAQNEHDIAKGLLLQNKVPADACSATGHWDFIRSHPSFTRDMRAKLQQDKGTTEMWRSATYEEMAEHVDAGGEDAAPETLDATDLQSMAVTRCSSTQYAVTAYFCGAKAAGRPDEGAQLIGGYDVISMKEMLRDPWHVAVAEYKRRQRKLEKKRKRELENSTETDKRKSPSDRSPAPEPRLVLRLAIGQQKRSTPSLEHVWSIVGLSDGTFLWLQSYIGFYTLTEWMDHAVGSGQKALSLSQLEGKLSNLQQLLDVSGAASAWTADLNADYKELFFADVMRKH